MRFQVSQVMDAIERRLTTDITGAQAVVDLAEIARNVELDRGRPVSLVRVGMVLDALSRYLVDDGALLYGVAERSLLAEQALTSKERMVLSRWADEGLIEVTPTVGDRVVEVADLTGLPLIATHPYPDLVKRFGWLADDSGRVLLVTCRAGVATLRPMDDPANEPAASWRSASGASGQAAGPGASAAAVVPVVGRAKVPQPAAAEDAAATEETAAEVADAEDAAAEDAEAEDAAAEAEDAAETEDPAEADEPARAAPLPLPVEVFTARGATRVGRTRVSWRRFRRAEPSDPALLAREWRCEGFECPAFGAHRRIGQPVPRMRGDIPVCPRHDEPVVDVGPRLPAYPVSIVVDDLPRRRLVVRAGHPVRIGKADPAGAEPDQPELVSVAGWLHDAAAARVSPVHLQLAATEEGLEVTDLSDYGAIVWQRTGPDRPGTTWSLRGDAYLLGEWDSVELYTGIELVRGDRRPAVAPGRAGLGSVLVDAPTAAHHQV